MKTRMPVQAKAAMTPSPTLTPVRSGRLQRKCACGGTAGSDGECKECRRKRLGIQTKLKISQPGDRYEQEADRVAETVARGGIASRAAISSLGKVSAAPDSKLTGETRGEEPKEKEEETVHRKALNDQETSDVPPIVHHVVAGGGQALDTGTRDFMESRFGYDFGRVRIHADALGGESARAVQAHAYTVGEHIVFDAGRYGPSTTEGKKLLAHELTHVVQQSGGNVEPRCQRQTGGPLLTGTHKPGGPSLRLVGAENIMGFNLTKAMCQCNKGDLLDRQIAKTDRASAAYRECGKTATSPMDLVPCVLPKVFGQQAGTKAPQVPPAGQASAETGHIILANEAEIKKRAELLNLPESGPCAELLRAGNLVHERQHVAQHEKVAAELGPAFAAEYNRLVWDEQRMEKLRAKFPRETAQFENKVQADVPYAVQREVEAYAQEKRFYTQIKAALERLCAVPTPTVGSPNIPPVRSKPTPLYQPRTGFEGEVEESVLQRYSAENISPSRHRLMPALVGDVIASSGEPLDAATRAFMEPRFGHDFGHVRVHTDAKAAESASAVNAHAYTVGHNVVFAENRYTPTTQAGRELLAHELAHTIQQSANGLSLAASQRISQQGDQAELEADHACRSVVMGHPVAPLASRPLEIARKKAPAGTVGKLSFDSNWSFVVYDDEIRLRYYEKGGEEKSAAQPAEPATEQGTAATPKKTPPTEIGTIPWVTNNPGNLTVDPEGDPRKPTITGKSKEALAAAATQKQKRESLQGLPYELGAVSAYAGRYAVFPSYGEGGGAILPYLQGIAEKSKKPNLTVEQALKTFKGREKNEGPEVQQKYVDNIRDEMIKGGKSREFVNELLARKIADLKDDDKGVLHLLHGLQVHEGLMAAPGITFDCKGEFGTLDLNLYSGRKKGLATQLTKSESAKKQLRGLLSCESKGGEEYEKKQFQRKTAEHSTLDTQLSEVPPIVNEVLRSPGNPLDADTRAFMESRAGHSFSKVRVHTDERASGSAEAVNALAYTVGDNIVFHSGHYAPGTTSGRRLLAHELTHVVQQRAGVQLPTSVTNVVDRHEQQADAVAARVVACQPVEDLLGMRASEDLPITHSRRPTLQRQKAEKAKKGVKEAAIETYVTSIIDQGLARIDEKLVSSTKTLRRLAIRNDAEFTRAWQDYADRSGTPGASMGGDMTGFIDDTRPNEVTGFVRASADIGTAIHEAMHLRASQNFRKKVGGNVNEGTAELFTRLVIGYAGSKIERSVYPDQTRAMRRIQDISGLGALAQWYFSGDRSAVEKALGPRLEQFMYWMDSKEAGGDVASRADSAINAL